MCLAVSSAAIDAHHAGLPAQFLRGAGSLRAVDWVRAGEQVRRARSRSYGTRSDFAAATGLSVSVLGELERGARSNFDPDTLARVEDALGWAPGAITDVAAGRRLRHAMDEHLARLLAVWRTLSPDARAILADIATHASQLRR